LAKKYEGYSGDSKYYNSTAKETNNNNDRYDKYDYNYKFRSDEDVKEKKEDKVLFYLKFYLDCYRLSAQLNPQVLKVSIRVSPTSTKMTSNSSPRKVI
jgi:hypothetical protein